MLITVLSILEVDFPLFPRNHVKCETFGVSLVRSLDCVIRFITRSTLVSGTLCSRKALYLLNTYQRLRLSNFSNRVQVYTYDSQIAPNHCLRSDPRYPRKRNRLSGNIFHLSFFLLVESLFFRHIGTWNGIRTTLKFFHYSARFVLLHFR